MNRTDFLEGRLLERGLLLRNAEQLQLALVLCRRHGAELSLREAIERIAPAYEAQHPRRGGPNG